MQVENRDAALIFVEPATNLGGTRCGHAGPDRNVGHRLAALRRLIGEQAAPKQSRAMDFRTNPQMPSSRRESFCLFVGLARTFKCAANLLTHRVKPESFNGNGSCVAGECSSLVRVDQQCCQRFAESNFLGRRYEARDLGPSMRMSCITGRSAETTGSPQAIASIGATGNPSCRDGSTERSAALR